MLSATNYDGLAFHTRSRTAQNSTTDNLTPHLKSSVATPGDTNITDTSDVMQIPLTKDRLQALQQMQKADPFCMCISKCLSNGRVLKHEINPFLHVKGLLYKHLTDSNQKIFGSCPTKNMEIHSTCGST